jgi:plasmid segregation protein ParM
MYGLGIDIGYSTLVTAEGYSGRNPHIRVNPVGVCPVDAASPNLGFQSKGAGGRIIQVNGEEYLSGVLPRHVENRRVLHANYTESVEYHALFNLALANCGQPTIDRLVTGLPVQQFRDETRKEKMISLMQGKHQPIKDGPTIEVREVRIVPQPFGAFCSAIMANQNIAGLLQSGIILVVDPGYYSLDWTLINSGNIQGQGSGGTQNSISKVLEEASASILERFDARVSPEKLEASFQSNSDVVVRGDLLPLDEAISGVDKTVKKSIHEIHQSMRGMADDVDIVILAGGGSRFWKGELKKAFQNAKHLHLDSPVSSNAHGYWNWGSAQ